LTSSELQTQKNLYSEEDIFGISLLSSSSSSIYFGTMTNDLTGKEKVRTLKKRLKIPRRESVFGKHGGLYLQYVLRPRPKLCIRLELLRY
jgi:hypothetical protein